MRKISALLLALVMLLACMPAHAEMEMVSYTHPTYGFTIAAPAESYCLDSATVADFVNAVVSGGLEGFDPTYISNLGAQIAATDMVMFLLEDGTNVSVTKANLGMEMSSEMFMSMIMPMLMTQFEALYEQVVFPEEPSMYYTAKEEGFCCLAVSYMMNGMEITNVQYYYPVGTDFYLFTLTCSTLADDAARAEYRAMTEAMLESFTLN